MISIKIQTEVQQDLAPVEFKERIIHIDGMDKTGKDSIRKELIKRSNGKYLIIVRSYVSQLVYAQLYNRKIDKKYFYKHMTMDCINDINFVILYTDKNELMKRFIDNNEQDLVIEDIERHKKMFDKIIKEIEYETDIKFIKINNTNENINITVDKIIKAVENEN
jgi:thymidylate kinase